MIMNIQDWAKDGKHVPKIHPTQKPVALIERLIELFTDPGDVVIDPCAGSGSTLVAAENLGRRGYGFEIKKDFCRAFEQQMRPAVTPSLNLWAKPLTMEEKCLTL